MNTIGELVTCVGCGEEGIFADEIFMYYLEPLESPWQALCLNCGPEENYENLVLDNDDIK